jgi:drug/metabolite transporter (DMT)-like permease
LGAELLSVLVGLASAASWGAGDFLGGLASRRAKLYGVVITSQLVGLVVVFGAAVLFNQPFPPAEHLLGGALAGLFGVCGVLALYQALATGKMGVAAPVSAVVAALVPVIISLFTLSLPDTSTLLGFIAALFAVWFVSRSGTEPIRRSDLLLPVCAGLGFGLFFVAISQVNTISTMYPLVAARLASLSLLVVITALRKQPRGVPRSALGITILSGALDAGGNAFFAVATSLGRLDVVAVLASLYPAVTVLLAWVLLRERVTRLQGVGVLAALLAVVLISA